MPCLALRLPSTGSTTTSCSGAPNERRPTSSDRTENRTPRSASACSSSKTTASAARSSSIVRSPPAPIASCCRPASVPARGATTSRTRTPMRRKVSSQSDGVRLIAASGFAGRGAGVDPAAPAAPALDHDGDQVRLLHRPHALDQLRDRDAVRLLDAQQDQPLRQVVVELSPIVQVQLLQGFEDVIKTPQTGPAILILRTDHRALELISLALATGRGPPRRGVRTGASALRLRAPRDGSGP